MKTDALFEKLVAVGTAFRLPGTLQSYTELKNGNINRTYKLNYTAVDAAGAENEKSYLAQKINTVAFRDPVGLMENIDRVTAFLRAKRPDAVSLHFHHTAAGENYLLEPDGFWRLSNYVRSVTFNSGENLSVVRSAGEAFGEFQMLLSDFDAATLHETIPGFHDTRLRYAALKEAVRADRCGRLAECKAEVEWLLSVEDTACTLTDAYRRGELPLRVTHNDTKINNVLFDEETLKPLVVIDLDTVMPGLVGQDFGDAIRFAANAGGEDCENLSEVFVDVAVFGAFCDGFLSKTAKVLTRREIETLGISSFAMTCELAARFLTDYLCGDVYFKVKRERHNLIRTRAQVALAKDMQRRLPEMTDACIAAAKTYRGEM